MMEQTARSARVRYRFGSYEIDLETRELRKRGLRIRISRQAFVTLERLLENPGELVAREELCHKLWPDGTHVQFDANLNAIIRVLREALGDTASNPRFIVTEPKLGYRFVAPVSVIGSHVVATDLPPHELEPVKRSPLSLTLLKLLAISVVAGLTATLFWALTRPSRRAIDGGPIHSAPTQITHLLGKAGHPSFSPDGSMLAFHWDGDERGNRDIYLKRIGSEEVRRLTLSAADDHSPVWSPDGQDIAFVRNVSPAQSAIILIPALGGAERVLARVPPLRSMCWTRDKNWIAYSLSAADNELNPAPGEGIHAISLATGETVRITSPKRRSGDSDPAFSPDSRLLAFVRDHDVYVASVDQNLHPSSDPRRLTFDAADARWPMWAPTGRAIFFSAGRDGYTKIWKLPYTGSNPAVPIEIGGDNALEPAIGNDGRRIVYSHSTLIDALNIVQPGGEPRKLVRSAQIARNPSYSADGRKIAFECTRSAHAEIWTCDSRNCQPAQLSNLGGPPAGSPSWSPDGRFIAFDARLENGTALFVIPANGGTARQVTEAAEDDLVPSWSRDGRWLYFSSKRTGSLEVWKMPSSGGPAIQVTRHGGFRAVESYDGRFVYYSKGGSNTAIWRVPATGAEPEQLVVGGLSAWQNFSLTPKGIYFAPTPVGGRISVRFYDFASGAIHEAVSTTGLSMLGVAASPDGRDIVFARREADDRDLILLDLF